MVNFSIPEIREIMNRKNCIRNMSVIAHVDHGKSTLTDSLIGRAGIIAGEKVGEARYTDTRQDEQDRAITIKSTGVSLYYSLEDEDLSDFKTMKATHYVEAKLAKKLAKAKRAAKKAGKSGEEVKAPTPEEVQTAIQKVADSLPLGKDYLINLIDSPGHVDFSSEVTAALRITDGALVVVDSVEGVCVQTETVLRQALVERIKPVLMINKLDRTILELQYTGEKAYQTFRQVIENVNAVISTYQNERGSGMGDVQVYPEHGTVAFGSGLHGWGFTLLRFGKFYAKKMGIRIEKFMKRLWGNHFWDSSSNKWKKTATGPKGAIYSRGFCQFIWDPINKLFDAIMNDKTDVYTKMFDSLGIVLKTADKKLVGKPLLKTAMRYWLPAADALLEMIVLHLPSPVDAQKYRVSTLYTGPIDDKAAKAIAACDPEGPVMMYVSKMVPASDRGRYFAFGRVFSGTIAGSQKVRILGPDYVPGSKEDLHVKTIQRTVLMMGRYVEAIRDVPCGNLVGLVGIDSYLVKSGTITTDEAAHPIATMKFSVSPVVRVAVQPVKPADMTKLVQGIGRLVKSDPCVLHVQEESGEHIICCVGELHLEISMNDLRELSGVPIRQSEPVVSYRETVTAESSSKPLAKSPNKHNRIWAYAEPITKELIADIEDNAIPTDVKLRSRYMCDTHGWDLALGRKIWSFGPGRNGGNMMVDVTKSVQYLHEVKDHIVNGFAWVARSGVLCEEEMLGARFNLHDCSLHTDSIHRGAGQITPTARRAFYASQILAKPRFLEPIFKVEIQVNQDHVGGIYTVLNQRNGHVTSQTQRPGTPLLFVQAELPVANSFGFTTDLRAATSGRAFPTLSFSHFGLVSSDPMVEDSAAYKILMAARERKGLKVALPDLSRYQDKL